MASVFPCKCQIDMLTRVAEYAYSPRSATMQYLKTNRTYISQEFGTVDLCSFEEGGWPFLETEEHDLNKNQLHMNATRKTNIYLAELFSRGNDSCESPLSQLVDRVELTTSR